MDFPCFEILDVICSDGATNGSRIKTHEFVNSNRTGRTSRHVKGCAIRWKEKIGEINGFKEAYRFPDCQNRRIRYHGDVIGLDITYYIELCKIRCWVATFGLQCYGKSLCLRDLMHCANMICLTQWKYSGIDWFAINNGP